MEQLFERGIMVMGTGGKDHKEPIGMFNLALVSEFPALRKAELEKMRWLEGSWSSVNRVPATRFNPAYTDVNTGEYKFCDRGHWICLVGKEGSERKHITFDPFSKQWIYLLAEGAYGILRSPGWDGNRLVWTGEMTMIGVNCVLRQSWEKKSDDQFSFINEERLEDGTWGYVDEWEIRRAKA